MRSESVRDLLPILNQELLFEHELVADLEMERSKALAMIHATYGSV